MSGWVKIHRKIMDSPMYKALNSKQRDVMMQCLLMANYKAQEWRWGSKVFLCKPGQFITSLQSLARNCGSDVKIQSVRSALLTLAKWQFLTNVSTKTGRLITILNWDNYQIQEHDNQQTPQQITNKDLTCIKEVKEFKEEKECIPFDEFWDLYDNKKSKERCEWIWKCLDFATQQEIIDYIPKYKKAEPDKRYRKSPENFLSKKGWKDELIPARNKKRDGKHVNAAWESNEPEKQNL